MKRFVMIGVIAASLVGCSTTRMVPESKPIASPTPNVEKDQTIAAAGKLSSPPTIDLPAWYIKAPASTDEYLFVTGTGVSTDLSMSRTKAMLDAQHQLADTLNGMIDAVVRHSKRDNAGTVTTDNTSLAVRKRIIDTSLTGHQIEDSKVQMENRGYRTFVLVRYPINDANRLLREKQRANEKADSDADIDKEFEKPSKHVQSPVIQQIQPQTIQLMDVDNQEYKARRESALSKPGAVIGQTVVR